MANKCYKQHIVPSFVIASFYYESDYYSRRGNRVYVLNDSGEIESKKAGANSFAAKNIYSPKLDASWRYYEPLSSQVFNKIYNDAFEGFGYDDEIDEIKISPEMVWNSIMPYMAGMVARAKSIPMKIRESKFNAEGQLDGFDDDVLRVIIIEMILSFLMSADIKIMRSFSDFVLPSNGCVYDSSSKSLLFPINSSIIMVASWAGQDGNLREPSILLEDQEVVIPIEDVDYGMPMNRFIASKSKFVIGGRLSILNKMIEDEAVFGDGNCGDLLEFIDFMEEHFPILNIRNWVDQILILIHKKKFMNYDRSDPIQMDLIFQMFKKQYGFWAPPIIVNPYRDGSVKHGIRKWHGVSPDGVLIKYDSGNVMDQENRDSIRWNLHNEWLCQESI